MNAFIFVFGLVVTVVAVPSAAVFGAVIGPWLLRLVFGSTVDVSSEVAALLAAGSTIAVTNVVLMVAALAGHRPLRVAVAWVAAVLVGAVAVVVAALVGLLSYHAASERIYQEIDASLRSAAAAVDNGETTGLAAPALPDRGRGRGQTRQVTAQSVAADGTVSATVTGQTTPQTLGQLQLARFINKSGLDSIGDNLFVETAASGQAITGNPTSEGFGNLQQAYLEEANVNAVTEISSLIAAQRAYEMNAKVVTAADQMMSTTSQMFRG